MNKINTENNYIFMLVGLLLLLILVPASGSFIPVIAYITSQIGFLFVMFIGIWSINRYTSSFNLCAILALVGLCSSVTDYFVTSDIAEIIALFSALTFCTISSIVAMKQILFSGRITTNKIVGSICIYLLIGVSFGALYTILAHFEPHAFNGLTLENAQEGDFVYYSFVTLTTLGYGDISPAIPLTRALAYLEAVVGQFYLTVLVASLVGALMNQRTTSS